MPNRSNQLATTASEKKSTRLVLIYLVQSETEHGCAKMWTIQWSNCGIKIHLNHQIKHYTKI